MYDKHKDAIFLENQKQRFQNLAEVSPYAAYYYESWERKELTLEQALSQTVEELTKHCYELLQLIPANLLVTFGQHYDTVKDINESPSYPLLEKVEFLTKYLQCLIDIVVCKGLHFSPLLVIKEASK